MNDVLRTPTKTGQRVVASASDLEALQKRLLSRRDPKKSSVIVCGGPGCRSSGCLAIHRTLLEELRRQLPAGLVQIMRLPGVGPKRARLLYDT